MQETPDPPEALSCMPSLQLSDIPREASTIPTDVASSHDATILTHDLFTNNVIYAEAALDLRSLPSHLLPLVPLFCRFACTPFTSLLKSTPFLKLYIVSHVPLSAQHATRVATQCSSRM